MERSFYFVFISPSFHAVYTKRGYYINCNQEAETQTDTESIKLLYAEKFTPTIPFNIKDPLRDVYPDISETPNNPIS